MHYESNRGLEVLVELFRAQYRQKHGLANSSVPALFVGSGVLRGVDGVGLGSALEEDDLLQYLRYLIGSSTGAACGQFGVAGQIRECADIYWTSAISREFLDMGRLVSRRSVQDTRFLSSEFQKRINVDALCASPVNFLACATHAISGEGHFLDTRNTADHFEAIRASMSIPILCGEPVPVDGELFLDGGVAMELPIRAIVERFHPTHLLIFANRPYSDAQSLLGKVIEAIGMPLYSKAFQEMARSRHERFEDEVAFLREQQFPWMIYWGPTFSAYCRDPKILESWAAIAQSRMHKDLTKARALFESEQKIASPLP